TAVRSLGSPPGRRGTPPRRTAPATPQWGGGWGICVVGDSGTTGIGAVGARRMIRVRASEGALGSGGAGASGASGSLGAVTSSSVVADAEPPFSEPRHRVDPLGAALQHLEMQVRPGEIAPVA